MSNKAVQRSSDMEPAREELRKARERDMDTVMSAIKARVPGHWQVSIQPTVKNWRVTISPRSNTNEPETA